MDAIPFQCSNKELRPHDGASSEEYSLPVYEDKQEWISCWQLDKEEVDQVLQTGRVWLRVKRNGRTTHPPLVLQASDPLGGA
jgi:hypothetical protein